MLPPNLQMPFFNIILDKGDLSEFETWLYNEPSLENHLTSDDYLSLISLDFKDKQSLTAVKKIINPYFDYTVYYYPKLLNYLSSLIENPDDNEKLYEIRSWHSGGYQFLCNLSMASIYLARIPVDEDYVFMDKDVVLVRVIDYHRGVREVKEQATWLYDDFVNGKLVLLSAPDDNNNTKQCYQDFRSEAEKARTDLESFYDNKI